MAERRPSRRGGKTRTVEDPFGRLLADAAETVTRERSNKARAP